MTFQFLPGLFEPLPDETLTVAHEEDEYVLDVAALTSNYRCIYGQGCQGTTPRGGERFGLYRPDGTLRPAGVTARESFSIEAPTQPAHTIRSSGVAVPIVASARQARFLPYIGYAIAVPAVVLIVVIALLSRVRRRPAW